MRRKGNPWALLVGMQIGAATVERCMEIPQKIKNGSAFWPINPTSGNTRSVQKVSSHVMWKIKTFIKDTRHKKQCTQDNDASVPFKIETLGPHTVLPIAISCPIIFSWIPLTVWNLFPFKGDFSWEKPEVVGDQIRAVGGLSPLGDLMFCQKSLHEMWCMSRHIVVMKLPIPRWP